VKNYAMQNYKSYRFASAMAAVFGGNAFGLF
jgi:hypothetical protein